MSNDIRQAKMKTSIIATGASLKDFPLYTIKGHKIAVNYAYKYVDYDFYVAMDNPVRHQFPDKKLHTHEMWVKKYNLSATPWDKSPTKGINREGKLTAYNSSLFAAINIALNLGFKEIDVYGADMCLTNDYVHFYSEVPCETRLKKQYEKVFQRHKLYKESFMLQLKEDEKINWINQPKAPTFNGCFFMPSDD